MVEGRTAASVAVVRWSNEAAKRQHTHTHREREREGEREGERERGRGREWLVG